MVVSIIGMVLGGIILAFGLFYLIKERKDKESLKIYGVISGIGGIIFIGMLVKLILELMG